MAGRSVSAVMVLGFLVVAAFCLQAEAGESGVGVGVDLDVKLELLLKSKLELLGVRLALLAGNEVECKPGGVAQLGPVVVKLEAPNLLRVKISLLDKDGRVVAVNANVLLDLNVVVKVVLGVKVVELDVVEKVVGNGDKLVQVLAGKVVVATLKVDAKLEADVKVVLKSELELLVLRLALKAGDEVQCKPGGVAELGPVVVKLEALNLLWVKISLFDKDGNLVAVKANVLLNLRVLAKVVLGVKVVELDVVEKVVGNGGKLVQVRAGKSTVVATLKVGLGH